MYLGQQIQSSGVLITCNSIAVIISHTAQLAHAIFGKPLISLLGRRTCPLQEERAYCPVWFAEVRGIQFCSDKGHIALLHRDLHMIDHKPQI